MPCPPSRRWRRQGGRTGTGCAWGPPSSPPCAGLPDRAGFLLIMGGFPKYSGPTVAGNTTKRIAPLPEDVEEASPVQPLTAEQARHVREQNPPVSPWRVVAGQAAVGLVAALAAW